MTLPGWLGAAGAVLPGPGVQVIEVDDMVARAGELLPLLTDARDRYLAALLWRFCDAS